MRKRAPTRPPPAAVAMPRRLGPYRLCMEIGAGGMATVYLARVEHPGGLKRFVALKRLRPHMLEQPTLAEMFFDEVDIASRLNHPNVCSVLDFDSRPESHYLAMEYLPGETLAMVREALAHADRPLSPARRIDLAVRVISEACEGLHAAHELRDLAGKPLEVVHRDVSPENIFVTYDGITKIVDFGVACAAGQRHETLTGIVKGKLAYLAPEVIHRQRPDRRADIWALGVVLWEMLTERRLFRRDSEVDTLLAVREARVEAPSRVCPDLPPDFDEIVLNALAADPDKRTASARQLGRELARVAARPGHSFGAAETAELMTELFPGGREHKRALLEAASEIEDDEVRVLPPTRSRPPPPPPPARARAAVLNTGDLKVVAPTRRRVQRWAAASSLLMGACLTFGALAGEEAAPSVTPAIAAAPPMPPPPAPVVDGQCELPTTIVLEQGTYLLEVKGNRPELQLLRREAPAPPRPRPVVPATPPTP